MTLEEARALYDECVGYGRMELAFVEYYKYVFRFAGENERARLEAWVGGDREDIYRYTVKRQPFLAPRSLDELVDYGSEPFPPGEDGGAYGFTLINKLTGTTFEWSTDDR